MAEQIYFFKKNYIDLTFDGVTITVTDTVASNKGQDFVDYIRNRKNSSAWLTTGSTDAANTTLEVDWGSSKELNSIILIGHNFKAFTVQYWTGVAWADFSTAIAETTNTAETNYYSFDSVNTTKIQIIITGTQVADADKILKQLIATDEIGQLNGWPVIKRPTASTNKSISRSLSGKVYVAEGIGAFSCQLTVENWNNDADLTIIETVYEAGEGVHVWLCGGDEDQFSSKRVGYRLEDLYFMRPTDEYRPEFFRGLYQTGIKFQMKLEEAIL